MEGLKKQKAGIDAEIEAIQAELNSKGSAVQQARLFPTVANQNTGRNKPSCLRLPHRHLSVTGDVFPPHIGQSYEESSEGTP